MIHEFMNSRERTARWVQTHVPYNEEFYSPSVPPTNMGEYVPSRPPSEAESSRSIPPKMVLRYNDGRPDIPIHHPNGGHGLASSRGSDQGHSPRHGRGRPDRHGRAVVPHAPEQIRILPATSGSRHAHARSKSMPRHAEYDRNHEPVPQIPSHHSSRHGSKHRGSPTQHKVTFAPPAQPTQPWHRPKQTSGAGYPQYSPQYTFPHQTGPNGVIYSHSAPTPAYYPPQPMPPIHHSHRRTTSVHDPRRRRSGRHPAAESADSLGTDNSGTYFVVPGPHGEKVLVIVSIARLMRTLQHSNTVLHL